MFKKLFVCILFFTVQVSVLFGCDWCSKGKLGAVLYAEEQVADSDVKNREKKQEQEVGKHFYQHYLGKYYPNARLMCNELFPSMCLTALDAALQEVVDLMDKKVWYYFLNNKKGFDARYINKIEQELSRIFMFFENAYIDKNTKKIFEVDPKSRAKFNRRTSQKLIDLLLAQNKTAIYDFYAICYDYLTVAFNALIISFFDTRGEGTNPNIFTMMEQVVNRLVGSPYEKYYQDAFKRAQRIIQLVQNRIERENQIQKSAVEVA